MVAARSKTKDGRAKRSYYGIDIHELMSQASKDLADNKQPKAASPDSAVRFVEEPSTVVGKKPKKTLLWTEKYRARSFMDLCGDDGTNRMVLRWLKRWDSLVFPGAVKAKHSRRPGSMHRVDEDKPHRKILMLTGPPGLGKTTLAHVCARQAGYEVLEVNASDDRSRDVVKNRIRTSLGTQSVKTVTNAKDGKTQRPARPMCVIVDEVDGVTSGSGASGDGGFIKALIDLVLVDQKNASAATNSTAENSRKKNRGDDFRQMRPLILICNEVYHPSLRPLRQSNLAEIIHVGRPSVDAAVGRLKTVFEKEGIPCEKDAARKLCEAAWGIASGIDAKRGAESTVEGDLRGVMVVGEWVAGRFRSSSLATNRTLTRQWIESNILHDLSSGAAGARGLGRGSTKDIINRLFQEGGGFPKQAVDLPDSKDKAKNMHEQPRAELGFGEQQKKYSMERLSHMINTSGEIGNIVTGIFAEYPNREFNDDCYLTKPNHAYDWLHFHDMCQSRLYASQEWELAPYLGQPVLACHHLFASPRKHFGGFDRRRGADVEDDAGPPMPFSGPRADYEAREAEKQSRAQLQALQAQLSPSLMRVFRSAEDVAAEFLPYLVRMVSPDVKPVVVGGSQGSMASVRKESERALVRRASEVLAEVGIALVKGKIENETTSGRGPQFVYRMDPDLDALSAFETGAALLLPGKAPTRYAVRQVLDQELQRTVALREATARQARFRAGNPSRPAMAAPPLPLGKKAKTGDAGGAVPVKRDFFGRVVEVRPVVEAEAEAGAAKKELRKVWVTFHEGLNNAVRKPISVEEFMRGL
ncbi:ATPase family associated with various cellular activities (AAA) domain-containing protein [Hirsutella rhossiliensis]